jgi:phosphate transport system protein
MLKKLFSLGKPSTLIERAFRDVTAMLQQADHMLDHSLAVLLDNQELEVDLEVMDDVIDDAERMVRRSVLEHMTVSPHQDLVASLILASIVQEAERIGDFARGLAEIAALAKEPRSGPFADELRTLAVRVRSLFEQCEEAFRKDDPVMARTIMATQRELKAELNHYLQDIADSDLTADMALVYGSSATMLRRISSHLSNIVSTVIQPFDLIRRNDEDA